MNKQHVDSTAVNHYIERLKQEIKYHRETLKLKALTGEDYNYYDGIIAGLQDARTLAEEYLRRQWND